MKRGAYYFHRKIKSKEEKTFFIDKFVMILAMVSPLFEIPQLVEIYSTKSAGSVSLLTWSFFVFMSIPWLIYGIAHKAKPIIILYSLWFLIDSVILVGILIYS